jgi:hypothetical protein
MGAAESQKALDVDATKGPLLFRRGKQTLDKLFRALQ